MKKMYCIIRLFPHERKLVPEIVPLWLKNRKQTIHAGGIMDGGCLYEGGTYTWSRRSVKQKVGLSAGGL